MVPGHRDVGPAALRLHHADAARSSRSAGSARAARVRLDDVRGLARPRAAAPASRRVAQSVPLRRERLHALSGRAREPRGSVDVARSPGLCPTCHRRARSRSSRAQANARDVGRLVHGPARRSRRRHAALRDPRACIAAGTAERNQRRRRRRRAGRRAGCPVTGAAPAFAFAVVHVRSNRRGARACPVREPAEGWVALDMRLHRVHPGAFDRRVSVDAMRRSRRRCLIVTATTRPPAAAAARHNHAPGSRARRSAPRSTAASSPGLRAAAARSRPSRHPTSTQQAAYVRARARRRGYFLPGRDRAEILGRSATSSSAVKRQSVTRNRYANASSKRTRIVSGGSRPVSSTVPIAH